MKRGQSADPSRRVGVTRTQAVLPRDNPFEILLDRFTVALPNKTFEPRRTRSARFLSINILDVDLTSRFQQFIKGRFLETSIARIARYSKARSLRSLAQGTHLE